MFEPGDKAECQPGLGHRCLMAPVVGQCTQACHRISIRVIEIASTDIVQVFPVDYAVRDLAFSPDGWLLVAVLKASDWPDFETVMKVWDLATGESIAAHTDSMVNYARFLSDGETVVFDRNSISEHGWNIRTNEVITVERTEESVLKLFRHFDVIDMIDLFPFSN